MGIIPGTTPTLVLTLDESIAGCTAAERNGSSYTYKIKFDGDTAASQKFYKTMDNLSITIGKRVL